MVSGMTAARSSTPIPSRPKLCFLDEVHIQSDLAQPRCDTKRTAEDAAFEDIYRNFEQDIALTKDVNGMS
jgi:hypothetical protein